MCGYTRWLWKAQDYSSCIVLYPLQVGCHIMSRTKQQWVTVVNSWQNKSRYKCGSCSTCQESTNRCQTTQFKLAILVTCAFIVRWQTNVKPKFLTDRLKGIWAFPIVIEVGRLWRCLVNLEVTSMSSVFLWLSSSMLAVDQALSSHIHDCIEWSSSDILSGGAYICNYTWSANEWCMIVWVNNGWQRLNIHGEKHRAKNGILRNTWVCRSKSRTMIR